MKNSLKNECPNSDQHHIQNIWEIAENLSKIIEGINDTYSPIIVDELLKRIERTINEFNNEIKSAFTLLKEKENQRLEVFKMFESSSNNPSSHKNEWEKKIDKLDSKNK